MLSFSIPLPWRFIQIRDHYFSESIFEKPTSNVIRHYRLLREARFCCIVSQMFSKDGNPEKAMPDSSDSEVADAPTNAPIKHQFGDAGPFGLSAFAFATFVMALFNLSAGGVAVPNLIIGPALIYGGLGQLLAGMWYVHRSQVV